MNDKFFHYSDGHDSNFCSYQDGKIKQFLLSERFSRIKYDDSLEILSKIRKNKDKNYLNNINFNASDYLPHHINHAAISFYNSGFNKSLVIVIDGFGKGFLLKNNKKLHESESIYVAEYPAKFKLIYKHLTYVDGYVNYEEGIPEETFFDFEYELEYEFCKTFFNMSLLFEKASVMIGSNPLDAGKVMGLSSYGKNIKSFPKFFNRNLFRKEFIDESKEYEFHGVKLYDFINCSTKNITPENYIPYADYAYQLQTQSQKASCYLIQKAIKETGISNVCISGGYGMNIVANHYYLEKFPNVNFYFEPLCDDSGLSIGNTMLRYRCATKDNKIYPLQHTFFHGFKYDLNKYSCFDVDLNKISELLKENKSIAVYNELAEAGKRSLGNRSILFNALNPDAKDIVNKIKKREWYRPFAAVVLEEDAEKYFEMGRIKSSPFMTIAFPVKKQFLNIIPGVVHVDGTCRVQTVSRGHIYELLLEFKKLTGHGILLNTSFNLAGEPLVETPDDAFKTIYNSSLDYLWLVETNQLFNKYSLKKYLKLL
jgi:carbamoyltransferase